LIVEGIFGAILVLSSLGVILLKKPVHACLSFLVTLMTLAALYLHLSAEFISVMQVLVYAGAILVIFMFVIVLFQDAYLKISEHAAKSWPFLIGLAAICFAAASVAFAFQISPLITPPKQVLTPGYGTVQALGKTLYIDFFFPFEAVILIFVVALVGAVYIGKKEL
jgi:NADH-quinone oxidoreductase subunit J